MVGQRFSVERTAAGQQFVIPGTEKPRAPPRIKYAREGSQLVIPGAEQVSNQTLLARIMGKPFRPRVGQRGLAGTSLFGNARPK